MYTRHLVDILDLKILLLLHFDTAANQPINFVVNMLIPFDMRGDMEETEISSREWRSIDDGSY